MVQGETGLGQGDTMEPRTKLLDHMRNVMRLKYMSQQFKGGAILYTIGLLQSFE